MWSIGVITYTLMSGYPPFWNQDKRLMLQQTIIADYQFFSPEWDEISEHAKSFIRSLIQPVFAERMTVVNALKHPWITNS
jgi:serine/threonine protein kinase